ncbi:MAG: serine/threonine-protein phosphatase [Planctomycetales bacterium]|nr:serine/threonine-protein phosphatase [Planctomycetales bacterium]
MSSSIIQQRSFPPLTTRNKSQHHDGPSVDVYSAGDSVAGGREYNEDRYHRCDESQFYLVVDGMGGHRGGALASQIAVETIPQVWSHCIGSQTPSIDRIQSTFHEAVLSASSEMSAIAVAHPGYDRMGCTLGAAIIIGNRMYFTNVGDCRVYLLRGNSLSLLTKDQTLVQGMVDSAILTASQAKTHRWRHIVTNSVSAQGLQQPPTLKSIEIQPRDRVLVTSDGMSDELSRAEIEQIMVRCDGVQDCVNQLIKESEHRNARDNVTCVVLEI